MLRARLIDGKPDESTVTGITNTERRLEHYRAELATARDKDWRVIYKRHIARNEALLRDLKVVAGV